MSLRLPLLVLLLSLGPSRAEALDYVTHLQHGKSVELAGKIEVEAEDGGVLLLAPDGVLWPLPKQQIVSRREDDKPFVPLGRDELAAKLAAELPAGFRIHQTRHYLICYNTSAAYAQWVGSLYEGLFTAFYNYWERRGATLHEPPFPLVALVFDSRDAYAEFSRAELGEAGRTIIGHYSLSTNRMTMYDLTGVEEHQLAGDRNSQARINQILSQPGAERTVATIVHEATHQLAFNSGLQVRFADIPFWLSEGIAIYFETPDLQSPKGWRNIGGVNRVNLINFRKSLRKREADGLVALLSDDQRFREAETAAAAYAEAWALTYFLLRTRKDEYAKYVQSLAEQTPLADVAPEQRLAEFKKFFGDDLPRLEAEFLRYMRSVN
ncbi:MAG: DUF1570 domain-containing protein [Pirellulaceae bacterium]